MSDRAVMDAIMEHVLVSEETAQEIIDYRRKSVKRPLTPRAARAIAKELAHCADPEAAIDYWMNRGWQGFKYDWYRDEEAKAASRMFSTGNGLIDALGRMQ